MNEIFQSKPIGIDSLLQIIAVSLITFLIIEIKKFVTRLNLKLKNRP